MSFRNLHVSNIPSDISNLDLLAVFQSEGAIGATVMMDAATGKGKGYGFVSFHSEEDGRRAIEQLNGRSCSVNGFKFTPVIAPSSHRRHEAPKNYPAIFVKNVPSALTEDELAITFSNFGTIVKLTSREDSKSKEMHQLYVEFETAQAAQAAIDHVHTRVLRPELSSMPAMAKFASAAVIRENGSHDVGRRRRHRKSLGSGCSSPITDDSRSVADASPDELSAIATPDIKGCRFDSLESSPTTRPLGGMPSPFASLTNGRSREESPITRSLWDWSIPSYPSCNSSFRRPAGSGMNTSIGSTSTPLEDDLWDNSDMLAVSRNSTISLPKTPVVYRHDPYRTTEAFVVLNEVSAPSSPLAVAIDRCCFA